MILERIPQIQHLTEPEKILLLSELWDALADDPSATERSREIATELDRRMAEYRADPKRVTTWEDIKRKILGGT